MEKFVIQGNNTLDGELPVNGAKNHALKMIPASLLANGPTVIHNVPEVEDVLRMLEIVEKIGGQVKKSEGSIVEITPPEQFDGELPRDIVPCLRASIVLVGPLLARYGVVSLPHPGGCNLGKRPIDIFIKGFTALGASIKEREDGYQFKAKNGLKGNTIVFPLISVTATETLLIAATMASGTTVLKNAACEPEIVALADYLNTHGADIQGAGTHTITIQGDATISAGEARIIPDRIETGSFVMLAAATNSNLTITRCTPEDIEIPLQILQQAGIETEVTEDTITILRRKHDISPVQIVTHEHPGFPTDLQSPMTVLLTQASGRSTVRETVYEGRLFYTDQLNAMGASINLLDPYRAEIDGPTPLRGKNLASPDIRAGIAMVIAGLIAEGTTTIQNIYQIDRGYERIEERLQSVGAKIERIHEHCKPKK